MASCAARPEIPTEVGIPSTPPHAAAPSIAAGPAAQPRSPGWRVLYDVTEKPIAIIECGASSQACVQHAPMGAPFEIARIASRPDQRAIAFLALGPEAACAIHLCTGQGDDAMCGTPAEGRCHPSNGSLRWLPTQRLLYTGGAGSGTSVAALYDIEGSTLWGSVHVASELSPSMRFLLVSASTRDEPFAAADTLRLVELSRGTSVATVDIPAGVSPRVRWMGDVVELSWPGQGRRLEVPGAGTLHAPDGEWRPFSE